MYQLDLEQETTDILVSIYVGVSYYSVYYLTTLMAFSWFSGLDGSKSVEK